MRDILFRGKRLDNGEWIEGYYAVIGERKVIIAPPEMFYDENANQCYGSEIKDVDLDTVCQYTGLTDKNGREIFEGDIVEGTHAVGRVKRRVDGLWLLYTAWQKGIMWGLCPNDKGGTTVVVIGNIFDNPELLKGAQDD